MMPPDISSSQSLSVSSPLSASQLSSAEETQKETLKAATSKLESFNSNINSEVMMSIVAELKKAGMNPKAIVRCLKEGLKICKKQKIMGVYVRLLELWGEWMKAGATNGPKFQGNTFNFNTGLEDSERQRILSVIGLLEAEGKRRGLPGFLPGHPKAQDSEALQRLVDLGAGEEAITDRGPS